MDSDNYKYKRLMDTYDLDTWEVLGGVLLTFMVLVAYVVKIFTMSWGWRGWLGRRLIDRGAVKGRGWSNRVVPLKTKQAAAHDVHGGRVMAKLASLYTHCGANEVLDAADFCLLMLTLGAWLFSGNVLSSPLAVVAALVILLIVGVGFVQTKDSSVGQSILYAILNVITQLYVVL